MSNPIQSITISEARKSGEESLWFDLAIAVQKLKEEAPDDKSLDHISVQLSSILEVENQAAEIKKVVSNQTKLVDRSESSLHFVWKGWADHDNPAMARLMLMRMRLVCMEMSRKKRYGASDWDTYRHGRKSDSVNQLLKDALNVLTRPDAKEKRLIKPALEVVQTFIKPMMDVRASNHLMIMKALAQQDQWSELSEQIEKIPAKTKRKPDEAASWGQGETAFFWNNGRQLQERNSNATYLFDQNEETISEINLKRLDDERESRSESKSLLEMLWAQQPGQPDLALSLLEKGWLMSNMERSLYATSLNDQDWKTVDQLWHQVWREGDSSKSANWTGRGPEVDVLLAFKQDSVEVLNRVRSRLEFSKKLLSEPRKNHDGWGASPIAVAAAMKATQCFSALFKESLENKQTSAVKINAYFPKGLAQTTNAKSLFIPFSSKEYQSDKHEQGLIILPGSNEGAKLPDEATIKAIKVNMTEVALLTSNLSLLIELSNLKKSGFKKELEEAIKLWNPQLPLEIQHSASELLSSLEIKPAKSKTAKPSSGILSASSSKASKGTDLVETAHNVDQESSVLPGIKAQRGTRAC